MAPSSRRYIAAGMAFHGAVYSTLAISAAARDTRRGWRRGRPGVRNAAGILPVAGGLAFIGWATAGHHAAAGDDRRPTANPTYLAQTGAYAHSRNPLYVGGMSMWLGWAALFGSRRSALLGAAWLAVLAAAGVPFEERRLERNFGDSYRAYRRRVPRWL